MNLFFRRVRYEVLQATGQKQSPTTYEALPVDRLVFRPALPTPPIAAAPPSPAMDESVWRYVNRENVASLKQFLSDYPASAHAGEADWSRRWTGIGSRGCDDRAATRAPDAPALARRRGSIAADG